MKIAIVGARGRMGRAVARLAQEQSIEVVLELDAGDATSALNGAKVDVVVDFSTPLATRAIAVAVVDAGVALVSGTTGLDDETLRALDRAATKVAVAWEPNMSVGVHVLSALAAQAARMLGAEFDVEIVEAHHRLKVDAPSGTALRLAERVRDARGEARFVHGREGKPGARTPSEIGLHAVRGGDVVGDHTVMLLGMGERIELVHRASNRDLFASGALRVARWIAGRAAGRYTMDDVLSASRA